MSHIYLKLRGKCSGVQQTVVLFHIKINATKKHFILFLVRFPLRSRLRFLKKAFHNFIDVPIFPAKREIIHIVLEWFFTNGSFAGGVFSLLSAHLANLLLHHEKVSRPYLKLVGVLSVSSLEVGLAIYRRFAPTSKDYLKVGFVAQLAGIFSGLTIGLVTNDMTLLTIQKGTQLSQGSLMRSRIPYH